MGIGERLVRLLGYVYTQRESVCCHIEEIQILMEDSHLEVRLSCSTQHADFNSVCAALY